MKLREWKNKFFRWLDGDYDVMKNIMEGSLEPDENHEQVAAMLAAYNEAVNERYRFFSFGDAMCIL